MKKPFYLHWFRVDPFERVVVLVVGDFHAAMKQLRNKGFSARSLKQAEEALDGAEPFCGDGPSSRQGRTLCCGTGDAFIHFEAFPTVGTLVHELSHAKDHILATVGVDDRNYETDAYILDSLMEHFFPALEKDRKGTDK